MTGEGAYADVLRRRFAKAVSRFGFAEGDVQLDCNRFAVPAAATADCHQMSLF